MLVLFDNQALMTSVPLLVTRRSAFFRRTLAALTVTAVAAAPCEGGGNPR